MTPDEADQQVAVYLRRLGATAPRTLPVTVQDGENVLGFAHADGTLSVSVLIYRFRGEPRAAVLDAVHATASPANTGGGRLVLADRALVLRREFTERTPDVRFAERVEELADAGLRWVHDLLARAAESAGPVR